MNIYPFVVAPRDVLYKKKYTFFVCFVVVVVIIIIELTR